MLVRTSIVRLLLLALLATACDTHPAATTPSPPGAPAARSSAPGRTPTVAPKSAAGATSHPCTFAQALAARIAQAPACADCDFEAFCQQPDTTIAPSSEGSVAWTPWSTNWGMLQALLPAHPPTKEVVDTREGTYPQPVCIPNQAGRQLYLVGEGLIALLEVEQDRFRALPVGEANTFGGVTHSLLRAPAAELLVLESVRGTMGMGRGASGFAITWLQVYDLARNTWALQVPVGCYNTHLGYTDEAGEDVAGGEQTIVQAWHWQQQGRVLVLGPYRVSGEANYLQDGMPGTYTSSTAPTNFKQELEQDSLQLRAPGRYAWRQGKYQP
jgi:hypothetical protein